MARIIKFSDKGDTETTKICNICGGKGSFKYTTKDGKTLQRPCNMCHATGRLEK